jgi:hypothetical protein
MTMSPYASWRVTVLAVVMGLFSATLAQAQAHPTPEALAREKLAQGEALVSAGDVAGARALFVESRRLYPSAWAWLAIARCDRTLGLLATARTALLEGLRAARTEAERNAVLLELETVETEASTLTVRVHEPDPDVQVTVDDQQLLTSEWDSERFVDGGSHSVNAVLPGSYPFTTKVEVSPRNDKKVVDVPPLEPIRAGEPAPPPPPPDLSPVSPTEGPSSVGAASAILAGVSVMSAGGAIALAVDGLAGHEEVLPWAAGVGGVSVTSFILALVLAPTSSQRVATTRAHVSAVVTPTSTTMSLAGNW